MSTSVFRFIGLEQGRWARFQLWIGESFAKRMLNQVVQNVRSTISKNSINKVRMLQPRGGERLVWLLTLPCEAEEKGQE